MLFEKIVAVFTAIITFFSSVWGAGIEAVNKYKFVVDTAKTGQVLSNPVSNVNYWSIEGNPFVGASVNEENNIFEFVHFYINS